MKTTVFGIAALASLAALTASGQKIAPGIVGGRLMGLSDFTVTDMMQFSQQQYVFGTARTAAMGGAFASLGADLSTMSINPAGLGMYRNSEFGFSPSILSTRTNSSSESPYRQGANGRTRFSPNNAGIAVNVYQGSGDVTSVTFGFAYNRLADFNTQSSIGLYGERSTIADVFAMQMRGFAPDKLGSGDGPFQNGDIPTANWGGVLAYQTELIDYVGDHVYGEEETQALYASGRVIDDNAYIDNYLKSIRKGRIGEYSVSAGLNIKNKLYLGLTVGIQDLYYNESLQYDESFYNVENGQAVPHYKDLNYLLYDQSVEMNGTGVNFKFGAIYRPITGLRIGLAVHTPTFSTVTRTYNASMNANYEEVSGPSDIARYSNDLIFDYRFNTPTRLLAGVSYTFGTVGIIAADYERAWYNGMRLRNVEQGWHDIFKQDAKNLFRATNNVRVGLELKPTQQLAIRAGYGYYDSGVNKDLTKDGFMFNGPVALDSYTVSGGIGYRFTPATSLDLAYVYMNTKYSDYDLFYYEGPDNGDTQIVIGQPYAITTKQNKHIVTLSLGIRF